MTKPIMMTILIIPARIPTIILHLDLGAAPAGVFDWVSLGPGATGIVRLETGVLCVSVGILEESDAAVLVCGVMVGEIVFECDGASRVVCDGIEFGLEFGFWEEDGFGALGGELVGIGDDICVPSRFALLRNTSKLCRRSES